MKSTIFIVITYYDFLLLVYTKPFTKPQTLKIPNSSEVLTEVLLRDMYNTRASFCTLHIYQTTGYHIT